MLGALDFKGSEIFGIPRLFLEHSLAVDAVIDFYSQGTEEV